MIQKDKGLSLLHAPGVPDFAECQADISDLCLLSSFTDFTDAKSLVRAAGTMQPSSSKCWSDIDLANQVISNATTLALRDAPKTFS
jgi:hypothetical protein